MNIIAIVAYVLLTSGGLVAIKLGTAANEQSIHLGSFALPFNLPILGGVILYGLSFLTYIFLISKFDLGFIIPIASALVYILIFAASYFIFHETFSLIKVIAIALIIFGILLLNFTTTNK